MAQRKRVLTDAEVTQFIAGIPSLTAKWHPKEQGGVVRHTTRQIAERVAAAFQDAGIEVRR